MPDGGQIGNDKCTTNSCCSHYRVDPLAVIDGGYNWCRITGERAFLLSKIATVGEVSRNKNKASTNSDQEHEFEPDSNTAGDVEIYRKTILKKDSTADNPDVPFRVPFPRLAALTRARNGAQKRIKQVHWSSRKLPSLLSQGHR